MKRAVDLALDLAQQLEIVRLLRAERVEQRLALAGGVDPALDAEPGDRLLKPKPALTTPIEPTIEDGSAKISSAAQASQ